MYKVYLIAGVAILAGCAATPPEPATLGNAPTLAAITQPSAVLDISDFTSSTVCKPVTYTGSRMIRGEACTTTDVDPNVAELERLRREWQISDINRRSQATLERQQRDAIRQSFPSTAGRL